MLRVLKSDVYNLDNAIRAMRHPLQSYSKSDSKLEGSKFILGESDLRLAKSLIKAGTDHRKFLREILVSAEIVAPRYWWIEFDTYKVGVTSMSTSTMHTITKKPLTLKDFSYCKYDEYFTTEFSKTIKLLNKMIEEYNQTKDKCLWNCIIQTLPQSYNQARTVTLNYEVLFNQYFGRENHKLEEWLTYRGWMLSLDYMENFIEYDITC